MKYYSTRGGAPAVSSARAVLEGLAPDGGLYCMEPSAVPKLDRQSLLSLDYCSMAAKIIAALLPDFSEEELLDMLRASYTGKFSTEEVAPLAQAGDSLFLELFRGPTSAFKDVALCLLPRLMKAAKEKCGSDRDILILTATSGDTGKAALEGFRDVPGIRIVVFYPRDGVSEVQKAQMITQEGGNVRVCAIDGNFDDAQTGVKRIFETFPAGVLSSANSINIGRLVPQTVYYFYAYVSAVRRGIISDGEKLNFCVPTGNFGDILAGYLAGEMGLPVGKFICASNSNNVLTDFIRTGVYDKRREFYRTLSPSMDILVSSNLERLLYLLSGDSELVASLMSGLAKDGYYKIPDTLLLKLRERFEAFCADDEETRGAIREIWRREHYLADTHTAVAWAAAERFGRDAGRTVVLSTASPYKFPAAVLSSVGTLPGGDEFAVMDALEAFSGVPMPANLRGLRERPVLHRDCVRPEEMADYVKELLEVQ